MVYLPNCGVSYKSLENDLRAALLVAFGDASDASRSIRKQIACCQTKEQLIEFCQSQPAGSLIFVSDQFNGVQEDSITLGSYKGSKQETFRDCLEQVRNATSLVVQC